MSDKGLTLLLTALFGVVVGTIHHLDPWHLSYDQAGWPYLLHAGCRLLLFPFLFLGLYGAGRLMLPSPRAWPVVEGVDGIDRLLLIGLTGVALLSVVGAVLVRIGGIRFELLLPMGLLLMAWSLSLRRELGDQIRQGVAELRLQWEEAGKAVVVVGWGLVAWLLLLLLAHLVTHGLVYQMGDNDIPGSYLPYYAEIMGQQHDLWPTFRIFMRFIAQGAGLHYLFMGMSDLFTVQLVNVAVLFLVALLLFQGVRKVTGSALAGLWGVVMLLQNPWFAHYGALYFKLHLIAMAWMVALGYAVVLIAGTPMKEGRPWRGGLHLMMAASVLLLPVSLPFSGFLLVWGMVLAWRRGDGAMAALLLRVGVVGGVVLAGVNLINWLQTGYWDFLVGQLDPYRHPEVADRWIDPFMVELQRLANAYEGRVELPSGERLALLLGNLSGVSMGPLRMALVLLVLGVGVVVLGRGAGAPSGSHPAMGGVVGRGVLALAAGGVTLSALLLLLLAHGALLRATLFRIPFHILVAAGLAAALLRLWPRLERGWRRELFLLGVLALWAAPTPTYPKVPVEHYLQLVGWRSYAEVVDRVWPSRLAWSLYQRHGGGRQVLPLNFQPGLYGLPGLAFHRPLQNPAMARWSDLLFGTPDQGAEVLRWAGIDLVLVDLAAPLALQAKGALFDPDRLGDHFRLLATAQGNGQRLALLTLRPGEGEPLPAEWRAAYRQRHGEEGFLPVHAWMHVMGRCLAAHARGDSPEVAEGNRPPGAWRPLPEERWRDPEVIRRCRDRHPGHVL